MDLAHLAGMGRNRQATRQSEIGDLDVFGDAAEPSHIGLDVVDGIGRDEGAESIERIELLAECDGDRRVAGERGMRADIVIPERLLEPEDVERLRPGAEALAGRQVPFAVAVDGERNMRADGVAHRLEPANVDAGIGMADLDLYAVEAVAFDRLAAPLDELVLRDREPADIGVVGLQPRLAGAAEPVPERHAGLLRLEIPERDIHRGERELGDAGATDPLQRRMAGELEPEPVALRGILAEQQRRVAIADAGGDQPVGGQIGMGAGETIALQPLLRDDLGADHAPMADPMRRIGDRPAGDGDMQDEGFDSGDAHGCPPGPPLATVRVAAACWSGDHHSKRRASTPEAARPTCRRRGAGRRAPDQARPVTVMRTRDRCAATIDDQEENGAQSWNRTSDTAIFSRMLYQLSYLGAGDAKPRPCWWARYSQ